MNPTTTISTTVPTAGSAAKCPLKPSSSHATTAVIRNCSNCRLYTITEGHSWNIQRLLNQPPPSSCCSNPHLVDAKFFEQVVKCWACSRDTYLCPPNHNQESTSCWRCRNAFDGAEISCWRAEERGRGYLYFHDLDEVRLMARMENVVFRREGKVCEFCGKGFKARGLKKHMKHCKARP